MQQSDIFREAVQAKSLDLIYIELTQDSFLWRGSYMDAVNRVLQACVAALHVERASIWSLSGDDQQLVCLSLFKASEQAFESGSILNAKDFPAYFAALESARVINASDAIHDARTCEFAETYLKPLGITAMLDAGLRHGWQRAGVLCIEHIGACRIWTREEQNFVVSLAELVVQLEAYHAMSVSEQRYRTLFEEAGDGIFLMQGDRFIDCNPAALAMFDCPREQLIAQSPYQFLPEYQPDGRLSYDKAQEKIAGAYAGETQLFEWQHLRCDGTSFEAEVRLTHLDLDGKPCLHVTVRDVTARKLAEMRMRRLTEMHQAIHDSAAYSIITTDIDGLILTFNPAAAELLGYSPEEVIGQLSPEVFHDPYEVRQHAVELSRELGQIVEPGFEALVMQARMGLKDELEWTYIRKDGKRLIVFLSVTALRDELGNINGFMGIATDISEKKQAEADLLERNHNLRLINDLSGRLHQKHTPEDVAHEAMASLQAMSDLPLLALYLLDKEKQIFQLVGSQGFDKETILAGKTLPFEGSLAGLAVHQKGPLHITDWTTEGRSRLSALMALLGKRGIRSGLVLPLFYGDNPLGALAVLSDKPEGLSQSWRETLETFGKTLSLALVNAENLVELAYRADHDSLTQLPNRRLLHRRFAELVEKSDKIGGNVALMLLDLDRFKEINDTLGHHIGDRLLQLIGPRLKESLPGEECVISRLGGDEFAVILGCLGDVDQAMVFAQRVREALRKPFSIENMTVEMDVSIGVALYPQDGKSSHDILRSADVAMYDAKHKGGGVAAYNKEADLHTPERLALMTELSSAVRSGQLMLFYQPKLDLVSGHVSGVEALLRWQHPQRGLLPPDKFIPLAEMGETIHLMTNEVIRLVLEQLQKWQSEMRDLSISLNLSARNLVDDRCVRQFSEMLAQSGVAPDRIEVEITETVLMHDPLGATKLLQQLTSLGVRIAVDDYGSGYSSLGYLQRLSPHVLKIDRQFVSDMKNEPRNAIIVRSTIAMAHSLGLRVVAEGVEDGETQALLQEMQCDEMQGYYLAMPMPEQQLVSWLNSRQSR